jgi:hypothetical protein
VSGSGGGVPRGDRKRAGEPGSGETGIDRLITALTAEAQSRELSGRDAALAAFRGASRPPLLAAAGPAGRRRHSAPPGRPAGLVGLARVLLPARLAVAAASVVAVLAGFTAAAAAQALPAPVEHLAYTVLAPLGVPVHQPKPGRSRSGLGHGQAAPSAGITVSAAPSGPPARATPGATAGQASRQHARTAAAPAAARVTAPATRLVPRLVLRLVSGKIDDQLTVIAPPGKAGRTVDLAEWRGAAWTTVAARPLDSQHTAFFGLPVTTAAGHRFRAEFPRAAEKSASVSNPVSIPRLPGPPVTGAKGSPTPDPRR